MNPAILMALFMVKHFIADFPLQTVYMLGKGKSGYAWIAPLAAHCSVHAFLSLIVICIAKPEMAYLVFIEFIAHFIIDRMKVTYKLPAGVWSDVDRGKNLSKYYIAFGLDQLAHNLTYALMIYFLI
jgi:hypothetical protein